jgi:putative FmdB family regulatory protein
VPTYQYACTACGHQLEAVQSFTDPALTECPECAGRLRKRFSSVGVVFKGSGFYRTDSRAAANGNGKSTEGKPAGDSKPAESKPAESKPAENKAAAPAPAA